MPLNRFGEKWQRRGYEEAAELRGDPTISHTVDTIRNSIDTALNSESLMASFGYQLGRDTRIRDDRLRLVHGDTTDPIVQNMDRMIEKWHRAIEVHDEELGDRHERINDPDQGPAQTVMRNNPFNEQRVRNSLATRRNYDKTLGGEAWHQLLSAASGSTYAKLAPWKFPKTEKEQDKTNPTDKTADRKQKAGEKNEEKKNGKDTKASSKEKKSS